MHRSYKPTLHYTAHAAPPTRHAPFIVDSILFLSFSLFFFLVGALHRKSPGTYPALERTSKAQNQAPVPLIVKRPLYSHPYFVLRTELCFTYCSLYFLFFHFFQLASFPSALRT